MLVLWSVVGVSDSVIGWWSANHRIFHRPRFSTDLVVFYISNIDWPMTSLQIFKT